MGYLAQRLLWPILVDFGEKYLWTPMYNFSLAKLKKDQWNLPKICELYMYVLYKIQSKLAIFYLSHLVEETVYAIMQ